jgi:hypothetical protein
MEDQQSVGSVPVEAREMGEADIQVQLALAELYLPEEADLYLPFDMPATLVPDLDEDRLLVRQREMMAYLGDPIGEESKPEKRAGLAAQQLDIEVRHGMRLLLGYGDDPDRLLTHLARCLEDADYGYGPNADNGRTIALGFQAIAGEAPSAGSGQALSATKGQAVAGMVADWLEMHAGLRQLLMAGNPLSMMGMHDVSDLDSFVPVLYRIGDGVWRLGVEGQGKVRDFEGEIWDVWGAISETMVAWYDEDNDRWLADLKRQAARLPDTIRRAAWGDRLRKDGQIARLEGSQVVLEPAPEENQGVTWPRFITLADRVGLTRLSGHVSYELSWDGGLRSRHLELSNTTRNGVPFEHTELAVRLAEVLAAGGLPDPAPPEEIEAAYLRRVFNPRKGGEYIVEMGPPSEEALPDGVEGSSLASYRAGAVTVTLLHGSEHLAYAAVGETVVVLRRDGRHGVVAAAEVVRGRVARQPLMTTPLDELSAPPTPAERRALAAWAAWLAGVVESKNGKPTGSRSGDPSGRPATGQRARVAALSRPA